MSIVCTVGLRVLIERIPRTSVRGLTIFENPIRCVGPLPVPCGTSFPHGGQEMVVPSMNRQILAPGWGKGAECKRGGKGAFFDTPDFSPG